MTGGPAVTVPPAFTLNLPRPFGQLNDSPALPVICFESRACIAHIATWPSRVKPQSANFFTQPDFTYDSICFGSPRPVTTTLLQTCCCETTCAAAATAIVVGAMIPFADGYSLRMLCANCTAEGVESSGGLMIFSRCMFLYFGIVFRSFTSSLFHVTWFVSVADAERMTKSPL